MSVWKPNSFIPFTGTVYILGGGPSLSNANLSLLTCGKNVIGVNQAYELGDWVNVCWFADSKWYEWADKMRLASFKGIVATCAQGFENHPFIYAFNAGKDFGIDTRDGYISWNYNSGGSAINLAYHLGAKRIVLLGFDMKSVNGEFNWHNDYPDWIKREQVYSKFLSTFPAIAKDAKTLGLEILNATPDSALKEFPMVRLEDMV